MAPRLWRRIKNSYLVSHWLIPTSPVFDPQKRLLSLTIVRLVILLTMLVSATIATTIVHFSDLQFEPTYHGWNNAIAVVKVPLGILAFLIPLLALLAANHRANQTKSQIEALEKQSTFSNRITHQQTKSDEIVQLFEGFDKYWKVRSVVLYRSLFNPESRRMDISRKTVSWIVDAYMEAHESAVESQSISPSIFMKYLEVLPLLESLGIAFHPDKSFENSAALHVETYIYPTHRVYSVPDVKNTCIEICKVMGV